MKFLQAAAGVGDDEREGGMQEHESSQKVGERAKNDRAWVPITIERYSLGGVISHTGFY